MSADHSNSYEFLRWDRGFTQRFVNATGTIAKYWFRPNVRGLESLPPNGGALVVSNHSGGMLTPDVLIFASAFYNKLGYGRPLYTLGHDGLFVGPLGDCLARLGVIRADRQTAVRALRSGGIVLTFPGGVYDAYRPTLTANVIDFNGRTGYLKTAIEAGAPVVPVVSIGGQESQLFLTRGTWLAKKFGLTRFRSDILPVTLGFPFGLSALLPVNIPLPTKITAQISEPIDVAALQAEGSAVDVIDTHVRSVMQTALDQLARERRLPVLG